MPQEKNMIRTGIILFLTLLLMACDNQSPKAVSYTHLENPVISQVFSGRWIPDTQPPRLLSARQLEGRKLELVFSEEVIGYETASNYSLRRGETIVPISAVASFGEAENTVIITAAEAIEEGNYTISCTNICDNSQEENPVENELSLALVASDPVVEEQEPEKTPIWPFVLAVVLLAIVGLGGFALFYGKRCV